MDRNLPFNAHDDTSHFFLSVSAFFCQQHNQTMLYILVDLIYLHSYILAALYFWTANFF